MNDEFTWLCTLDGRHYARIASLDYGEQDSGIDLTVHDLAAETELAARLDALAADRIQARAHRAERYAREMPVGDQLDAVLKTLVGLREGGTALPAGTEALIERWLAIKGDHPKPEGFPRRRCRSKPKMPDPVLEQALREAYASAPADTVILHTIELRHPAFVDDDGRPTAIRVVRDHVDLTARLEATAPLDAGETVWFVALAFDLELPPVDSAPMPEISVTLDNVGREIVRHLDAAATSRARIEVTYAMPPGASSAGWARAAPPAERRLRSGTLRAATAARIAADGGDEAVCRVDRQTQGYQAACGLHEVGLRVPTVPGPARARSRCQQHGEHRSNRSQGAECGATVLRRGDRAGQGYRRSRRGQGKCGRDVEMDRHEPAPQVGGPWRGCGILQACVDGEKKNPP